MWVTSLLRVSQAKKAHLQYSFVLVTHTVIKLETLLSYINRGTGPMGVGNIHREYDYVFGKQVHLE